MAWIVFSGHVAVAQRAPQRPKPPEGAEERMPGPGAPKPDREPAPVEPEVLEDDAAEPVEKFKELPVDSSLRSNSFTINQIMRDGRFGPGQQETFDQYFTNFVLPRWTQQSSLAMLPKLRQELSNQLRKKSPASEVHDHLAALALDFMNQLAAGPYHPAVRYNAMLMIGELNGEEYPPTPLPEALEVLLDAAGNAEQIDAVRVAALIGIQRHANAKSLNEETRGKLETTLLDLLNEEIPTGTASAGREWILAQAAGNLAQLGSVGKGNAVFKALLKVVANEKLSLSTRTIAVESLGRLNYTGAAGLNISDAVAAIGQFAIDVCEKEIAATKDAGTPISRRRLKKQLGAVLVALNGDGENDRKGLAPLARDQAQQAFVAGLQKEVEGFIALIDERDQDGIDLEKPLDRCRVGLEAWLKKKP